MIGRFHTIALFSLGLAACGTEIAPGDQADIESRLASANAGFTIADDVQQQTAAEEAALDASEADGIGVPGAGTGEAYEIPLPEAACAQGLARGHWVQVRDGVGYFYGRYRDANGTITGSVRGIWGRGRLAGKYVDADGKFQGLIGGVYGDGSLAGRWVDRDRTQGVLRGRYQGSSQAIGVNGDNVGTFGAAWRELCRGPMCLPLCTEGYRPDPVHCTCVPISCAPVTCALYCELGNVPGPDGCPTCACNEL